MRDNEPANATLSPISEALAAMLQPQSRAFEPTNFDLHGATAGPLLPDEGHYHVRHSVGRRGYIFRGACEEIEFEIDAKGKAFHARRRSLDQGRISVLARHEFAKVAGLLVVNATTRTDLNPVRDLIDTAQALSKSPTLTTVEEPYSSDPENEEPIEEIGDTELLEDALEEEIAREARPDGNIDVAALWERLIAVEREMSTDGVALGESGYRRDIKRHLVPFELESGSFEYNRDDRVLVERLDRRGAWRSIGELDLQGSKPDLLAVDVRRFTSHDGRGILEEGQRVRLKSHFEETSLQRRKDAITRILAGHGRLSDLADFFDPSRQPAPRSSPSPLSQEELAERYALNEDQSAALAHILATRPLGLLQGPPGTGKTVFISALIHAALTTGLARNILLTSQSHEAVNNAAEAVLERRVKNLNRGDSL